VILTSALPPALRDARIALVGVGRLGATLGRALAQRGLPLVAATAGSPRGCSRAEEILGITAASDLGELIGAEPTLVLLAVPDGALPGVAGALAEAIQARGGRAEGADHSGIPRGARALPAVAHTSGATSVSVLKPLAELSCVTFGLHPLQTFADRAGTPEALVGTAFAVTPGPTGGEDLGFALAGLLGGRPFLLAEKDRPLYHAAAVVASNYLVALEHVAERLFQAAGMPADQALGAFLPLVRGTVENMAARGTAAALTGPLSRGDEQTIALHLETLAERRPEDLDLYRILGLVTLELVAKRGEVPPEAQARLRQRLSGPLSAADSPSPSIPRAAKTPEAQEASMDSPTTVSGYSASGTMQVVTHSFTMPTEGEADIHNITDEVRRLLAATGLDSGTATVFMPGATGAVTTLEFEPGVVQDFKRLFDEVAARARDYQHNVMLGDGNGHSHVRAGLLGPSLVVPFAGNRLILGTWQEICLVDFDNRPRDRKVVVQFMGV
jgi:secondary thiamine-phosphate synthase enzyme